MLQPNTTLDFFFFLLNFMCWFDNQNVYYFKCGLDSSCANHVTITVLLSFNNSKKKLFELTSTYFNLIKFNKISDSPKRNF